MNAPPRFEIFRVFTDMDGLHEAWRERAEDLNRSRVEIGLKGQLLPGYAEKMLCDPPMRYVGRRSLEGMLKGTDTYLALVVDKAQTDAYPSKKRKLVGAAVVLRDRMQAAAASIVKNEQETANLSAKLISEHMRAIGEKGNKMGASSKGGKRRAQTMSKRARQRIAQHAARLRWSKQKQA